MIEFTVSAATYTSAPPEKVTLTVGPDIVPTDPQTQKLIIQALFGWSTLDYYVRMALKRLTGKEITAAEVVTTMSSGMHHKWLEELRSACTSHNLTPQQLSNLLGAVDAIGTGRADQKIYGRRNEIIHSIFGRLPSGEKIFQRIGDPVYLKPSPLSNAFLSRLVNDIWDAIAKIDGAVPP